VRWILAGLASALVVQTTLAVLSAGIVASPAASPQAAPPETVAVPDTARVTLAVAGMMKSKSGAT